MLAGYNEQDRTYMIMYNIFAIIFQVCTGVMMHGYGLVKKLCDELKDFMRLHNFSSIEDFRGYCLWVWNLCFGVYEKLVSDYIFLYRASLPYFTTHTELVRMQQEAIRLKKATKKGLTSDKDWTGDGFVQETESMVSN